MSGGIAGAPRSLPKGWTLVNGYLIGPWANLVGVDLANSDLSGANLTDADLTGANLTNANLSGADLTGADLTNANLTDANLTGADLTNASLAGANFSGADLTGVVSSAPLDPPASLPDGSTIVDGTIPPG